MTDQPAPQNIDEALLALQAMNLTVRKTAEGAVRAGKTDKYADLGEYNRVVLTALNNLGVIWKCLPTVRGENFVLAYSLMHVPSGTAEEGEFPIPKGDPQKMGSAITYARRYALGAVTGVAAEGEDDDGQGRGGMAQRANVRQQQTRPEPTTQRTNQPPPAPRGERARPPQQPDLPPATGGPQGPPPGMDPAANAPAEPHRGRGGLITQAMVGKLMMCMKEIGVTGNGRLPYVADLVGRPELRSSKDLTFDEGRALIDAMEKAKGQEDPADAAVRIYLRTTGGGADEGPPSMAEQTRRAVVGEPAGPNDRAPWDDEQQALM